MRGKNKSYHLLDQHEDLKYFFKKMKEWDEKGLINYELIENNRKEIV